MKYTLFFPFTDLHARACWRMESFAPGVSFQFYPILFSFFLTANFFLFGLSHIQYISTENLYILMNKHVKYQENLIITHKYTV